MAVLRVPQSRATGQASWIDVRGRAMRGLALLALLVIAGTSAEAWPWLAVGVLLLCVAAVVALATGTSRGR